MGEIIEISAHALGRYIERVRPSLTHDQAQDDLARLIATHGQVDPEPPCWLRADPDRAYLTLGPDICLPLEPTPRGRWIAVTTAAHGSISEEERRRRNEIAGRRRFKRTHRPDDEGPRPLPPEPTVEAAA